MLDPHYYVMKCKKILRLEGNHSFSSLPLSIREKVIDPTDIIQLNQNQANWRVVIFRDEIMEFDEYVEWLASPEAMIEEEEEYDLTAN